MPTSFFSLSPLRPVVVGLLLLIPSFAFGQEIVYRAFGATRTVSGSLHTLEIDGDIYVVDVGSYMGGDGRNFPWPAELPVDKIKAVFVTHAHADHVGRIPLLLRLGYDGPIYMNEVTRDLTILSVGQNIGLADFGTETFYYSRNNTSARKPVYLEGYDFDRFTVQERNRVFIESRRAELNNLGFYLHTNQVQQLRAEITAELENRILLLPPNTPTQVGPLTVESHLTSHMPGASMFLFTIGDYRVLFTGDVGSDSSPLLPPTQTLDTPVDVLVVEGTYADDRDFDYSEARQAFRTEVGEFIKMGYRVIIPAFVLDRTQQVLFELEQGMSDGSIPRTTVHTCSRSANEISEQYQAYAAALNAYSQYFTPVMGAAHFGAARTDCQDFYIPSGEIGVLSSGMAEFAFAFQALKNWVSDPKTIFYFVGYQGPGTPGHDLTVRQVQTIHLGDEVHHVNAQVRRTSGFSGHATPRDIERLFGTTQPSLVLLVHHEDANGPRLVERYTQSLGPVVLRPEYGQAIPLPRD